MKKRKIDNNRLNDNFQFKLILMDVFSGEVNNKKNDWTYYLLVDENNFIHDYKIQAKRVSIKTQTTKSHSMNNKRNSKELNRRKEFLEELNLKHEFVEDNKKSKKDSIFFDENNIDLIKFNKWLWDLKWTDITFQNIEYILNGSNPSGQGNGRGFLNIFYNNSIQPFGFFLQTLNISKTINKLYKKNVLIYDLIWSNFDSKSIKKFSFEEWVEENEILDDLLKQFKLNPENWKQIIEEFRLTIRTQKKYFEDLEQKISKLRTKQKKLIKNKYKKRDIIYDFFSNFQENNYPDRITYAHIKPVWKIKKEYLTNQDNKESILEQISDINNFLPLSPNIHDLYDNYYFYWTNTGELKQIKEINNKNEITNYSQINKNKLESIQKYLNEYKEIINQKYKIK